MKTLEESDFSETPQVAASRIRSLAEGGYLARSEPIIFLGEAGTRTIDWVGGRVSLSATASSIYDGG